MIRSDMNLELVSKGVIEMAALVRSGKVSPVDLLEAHLAQIEICNPKINAVVSIDQEAALAAAYGGVVAARGGNRCIRLVLSRAT